MQNCISYIDRGLLDSNRAFDKMTHCVDYRGGADVEGGRRIPVSAVPLEKHLSLPVFQDEKELLLYPMAHTFIFGSTGTGKSTVLFENHIRFYSELAPETRPSMMITDLKGEISPLFAGRLRRQGYDVKILDMTQPLKSDSYNMLTQIYDDYTAAMDVKAGLKAESYGNVFRGTAYSSEEEARNAATYWYLDRLDKVGKKCAEFAAILIPCDDLRNLTWFEGGRNVFVSVILAILTDSRRKNTGVTRENFNISSAIHTVLNASEGDFEYIKDWLESAADYPENEHVISDNIRQGLNIYCLRAQITRDGYLSTCTQALNSFRSITQQVLTGTARSLDLRAVALGSATPTALFIITDDQNPASGILTSMLIDELSHELADAADTSPGLHLSRPFVFMLDEFGNLPSFPNIAGLITTGRSRWIWAEMAIQSLEQLTRKYGQETSRILLDNCGKFFLGINSVETKRNFATEMGQKQVTEKSANIDPHGAVSYSVHTVIVPSVSENDLDSLHLGEFYVNFFRCQKIRSSMIPYFLRRDTEPEASLPPLPFRRIDIDDLYSGPEAMRNADHWDNGLPVDDGEDDEEDKDDDDAPLTLQEFLRRRRGVSGMAEFLKNHGEKSADADKDTAGNDKNGNDSAPSDSDASTDPDGSDNPDSGTSDTGTDA